MNSIFIFDKNDKMFGNLLLILHTSLRGTLNIQIHKVALNPVCS